MGDMIEFELTEEHVKLLRRMFVEWDSQCYFGAPCIDMKRPYGNKDVLNDIAEIVGEKDRLCPHCGESLNEQDAKRYEELHKETETALQVVLATGSFEPGKYRAEEYTRDWVKVE